jgi:predicted nucleic acid-binding protein
LIKAFVLDVSACMPWCCEDETTPSSDEMLDWAKEGSELHVPSLWGWEIMNAIGVAVRRRRIKAERGKEFLEQLAVLNFKIDAPPQVRDFPRLHGLATMYELTSYDVAYLDLAKRLSLPLATRDGELARAAVSEGIEVLGK